ncbi:MAG: pilus assembly protein TadG-related protein [Gammaproteobacteria bacterium]|nr:pilus assembly protein TadG-related protein [Gammaproteobacteria bacterium]
MIRQRRWTAPARQSGVVAAMVMIALVAMLGIVGLALDGGHGMLNKSRLQTLVDAAALSSAKVLDLSDGDELLARDEALDMFANNAAESGNAEIAAALGSSLSVNVQFSATLDPFIAGTAPAQYVRVRATGLDLPGWFIPVMGFTEKSVSASAVAGPSPQLAQICELAPIMACGDPLAVDGFYGYAPGEVTVLKSGSNGGNFEVGPGNFQLVRLDGASGGADIRDALAGTYSPCLTLASDDIPTEPGNTVGPVAQGLNTRLGKYLGPMAQHSEDYPSDLVQDQISPPLKYVDGVIEYEGQPLSENPLPWDYQYYLSYMMESSHWSFYEPDGRALRRVLRLPVGDCDGTVNGAGEVPMLGVLCFFVLQEVSQQGNEAEIFGQFMGAEDTCSVTGKPGPVPGTGPGPYRIQLYKDTDWETA